VPKDKFEPVDNPEAFYRDADLVDYYQQELASLDKDDKGYAAARERLAAAKRAAAMTNATVEANSEEPV
jgi:hypothetical protein